MAPAAAATPIVGDPSSTIAVGEVNGDGRSDLAIVNDADGAVGIHLQRSGGGFAATADVVLKPPIQQGQPGRYALVAGDLDSDGKVDLVLTNNKTSHLVIFLGAGDGSFAAPRVFPTLPLPAATAVGDFNNDGKPDLAVVSQGSNKVGILRGAGDGTFTPGGEFAAGQEPSSIILGDFGTDSEEAARDGKVDIAVIATREGAVVILFGNGKGGVTDTGKYPSAGSTAAVAADFNSDGLLDLATVKPSERAIGILLGRKKGPDGSFTAEMMPTKFGGSIRPTGLAVADLDGDTHLDLAVAGAAVGRSGVFVLLSRPRPNLGIVFFDPPSLCALDSAPSALAGGDFAGKGRPIDVAVAQQGSNALSLLSGDGAGGFTNCPGAGAPGGGQAGVQGAH